jgi:hypothetical protein
MRVAVAIELTDQERATLESYARGRSTPARLVLRAKVVLQAAKGLQNKLMRRSASARRSLDWWFAFCARHPLPSAIAIHSELRHQ